MDKNLIKMVLYRFIRGFVSGFIATGIFVIPNNITTLSNLKEWGFTLGVMAIVSGLSGGFLALDKCVRELLKENE